MKFLELLPVLNKLLEKSEDMNWVKISNGVLGSLQVLQRILQDPSKSLKVHNNKMWIPS